MNDSSTTMYLHSRLPVSTVPPAKSTLSTTDPHGAMVFVIATVCIYGLSIVFFIAGHIQKRQMNRDEEKQISRYLKRLHRHEAFNEDRQFRVLRFKSYLLADSALGQRHNRRISLLCRRPPGFVCRDVGDGQKVGDDNVRDRTMADRGSSRRLYPVLCGQSAVSVVNDDSKSRIVAPSRARRHGRISLGNDFSPAADNSDNNTNPVPQTCLSSSQPLLYPSLPAVPLPSLTEDETGY